MPSIRQFAASHGVSPFTVVASLRQAGRAGLPGIAPRRRLFRARALAAECRRALGAGRQAAAALERAAARRRLADPQHVPPGAACSACPAPACCRPTGSMAPAIANALRAISRQNQPAAQLRHARRASCRCASSLQLKLAELEIAAPRRADRHHGRRDPGAGPGGARIHAPRRHGLRRRPGLVPDVRLVRRDGR